DSAFADRIARLSEPGGSFDSDNLISNESSYLHPIAALRAHRVSGGAYIGVGPDQNFSYIAAIRPRIAYIIDIRRDNMLQHLMFKALFERSRNRLEYLCRWLGYGVPSDVARWTGRAIDDIVTLLDTLAPNDSAAREERGAVARRVRAFGVQLDEQDSTTLARFHATFQRERLALRFSSTNRSPRPGYPSLRELILARDAGGAMSGYLAQEASWAFVKGLQAQNRIVPVVGDLAGSHALAAIGREVRALGERVSVLYVSNVEQYLWRDATFPRYAAAAAGLPHGRRSLIIRSYFGRSFASPHPLAQGSTLSTQLLQPLADFARRQRGPGWTSYWELVTLGAIDPALPAARR
ncbi:MAG: LIC_10091 family protein, partial [Gemmatimonadaceae bacterium]